MEVTLHIGAHRTASTSFQCYMRQTAPALAAQGVGFWGPLRLRKGAFQGVIPNPLVPRAARQFTRAKGRIAVQLAQARAAGLQHLVVSEENILGTMHHNLAAASLYPDAGQRVGRYIEAFDGAISQVSLSIRALDSYWVSVLSFSLLKGRQVPNARKLRRLALQGRDWREVIGDVAQAAPGVQLLVHPFERMAAYPDALASILLAQNTPPLTAPLWRNARPSLGRLMQLPLSGEETARLMAGVDGTRWQPFDAATISALQERYHDDIFWLRAGADGLARLVDDIRVPQVGEHPPLDPIRKGRENDQGHKMARSG